jgi:hypothetical protein
MYVFSSSIATNGAIDRSKLQNPASRRDRY